VLTSSIPPIREKLMNTKSLITLPVVSIFFGLTSSFADPAFAECTAFGSCSTREYRTHCEWKSGKFGMKYRSCAAQYRVCKYSILHGGKMTPTKCDDWHNRF
jgi:hypothetical protein